MDLEPVTWADCWFGNRCHFALVLVTDYTDVRAETEMAAAAGSWCGSADHALAGSKPAGVRMKAEPCPTEEWALD